MRTIELDGRRIQSIADFYDQIEEHLGLGECPWGRNLDSLDEITLYNFNYTENKELDVNKIIWKDSEISRQHLIGNNRKNVYNLLVKILSDRKTIELILA